MTEIANPEMDRLKAVLLVGGLGMRLRSVTADPKPLATVGGIPFLELPMRQLRAQGVRRLVLCTGYRGELVEERFGDGGALGLEIEYSKEDSPLGTAGAIRNARARLEEEEDFLVMNGDSFLQVDFLRMIRFHSQHGGLISMAVFESGNAERFGSVKVDHTGRVTSFSEKTNNRTLGLMNGGIYVFNRRVFDYIPDGPSSLEREVFPSVLDEGIFAQEQQGIFIDIGTPEDYARAGDLYDRIAEAAAMQ